MQIFLLSFADDLVLVAPSPDELQRLTDCFVQFCSENKLEINLSKTKAMYVNRKAKLRVGNFTVKTVAEFKYLGLILSNSSKRPDILLKGRINKARATFYAVKTNCRILGISNIRVKL